MFDNQSITVILRALLSIVLSGGSGMAKAVELLKFDWVGTARVFLIDAYGTVCWMTPYRQAYMDLVKHVVCDYEIDGMYFDKWVPFYFWPESPSGSTLSLLAVTFRARRRDLQILRAIHH